MRLAKYLPLRMEFPAIKEKVNVAISCFRSNDSALLDFDNVRLPERPISHRLGFYMQFLFSEYNVDCEYNRHLEGLKKMNGDDVIPDIMVHRRKMDEDNLLVVEVKARRNLGEAKRDQAEFDEDYRKLSEFTRPDGDYKYDWGASILILTNQTEIKWFADGVPKVG